MAHSFPYSYLVGSLLFVPLWIAVYRGFPALRREMLVMSGLFLCIGVPMEGLLYTKDWWHPATITGTTIGVEDIMYSIGNGGYLATLYAVLFRGQRVVFTSPPRLLNRYAPVAADAADRRALWREFPGPVRQPVLYGQRRRVHRGPLAGL